MGGNSNTKPIITRKLVSLIIKKGFYSKKGSKHGKYIRDGDDHVIMIPRHKTISPGLSHQIRKELVEKHGLDESDVLKI